MQCWANGGRVDEVLHVPDLLGVPLDPGVRATEQNVALRIQPLVAQNTRDMREVAVFSIISAV